MKNSSKYALTLFAYLLSALLYSDVMATNLSKVSLGDFPSTDLPSENDKENLIGEASKNFYYGIGVPRDYVKARYAAFLEFENLMESPAERDNDDVFGGGTILMMLYANGLGVKRDIDLSARLASFNVPGTPEETEQRVAHLERLKWFPFWKKFDFGDDVSPDGEMRTVCLELKNDVPEKTVSPYFFKKIQKLNLKAENWSLQTVLAFRDLTAVADRYFLKRIYKEVDSSGTDRAEVQNNEYEGLQDGFVDSLHKLELGHYPGFDPAKLEKCNKEMMNVYRAILESKRDCGTINSIGVRVTQRRWIAYREAWLKFAALRYPAVPADSFAGWLTSERISQLQKILNCEQF